MTPERWWTTIGIGATPELSLRVSVASLVRVLLDHPKDRHLMLALERKATFFQGEGQRAVSVQAQPFGGAMRIHRKETLQNIIGDFHFDSQSSQAEQDFRIFIRPSAWEAVREFCLKQFKDPSHAILESDPGRELTEELHDSLQINLTADQYRCQVVGTIVEDSPAPTENIHATGSLTARIFRVFEARMLDSSLVTAMLVNSETYSDHDLYELAFANSRRGNPGRANAVLTLPLHQLFEHYSVIPPEIRNYPTSFHNHQLDETVAAVLDDVAVPKYQRYS